MTDHAFELFLTDTAAELPSPGQVAVHCAKIAPKRQSLLRPALIMAAILLLIYSSVTAYNRTDYGLRATGIGATLDKIHYRVSGISFLLPEKLATEPYVKDTVLSLVPHEASFWQALFTPRYHYVSVNYGGNTGISISAGPTLDPYWQHVFSYAAAEPDVSLWTEQGYQFSGEKTYRGYRVFFFEQDERISATWMADGMVYDVTVWIPESPDTAFACAQAIIDLNADK